MANTGRKIYPWLIQVDDNGDPTGLRKLNKVGDPDYYAPIVDYDACPLPVTTTTTSTTTTTTSGADPLIIKAISGRSDYVGLNNQAWNVQQFPAPNPPIILPYYGLYGTLLTPGGQQVFYNGTFGAGDYTKLRYENVAPVAVRVDVYFSNDNGSSYIWGGFWNLAAASGGVTPYPAFEHTFYFPPNNTGVTNLIEFRVS